MSKIKVIPFGGVREHGKNMYAVEVDRDIYILDCGLKIPETEMLGIDVVIPDFAYLIENQDRIAGIFLTHGHADAIGALPYLLEKINVPVFGSDLTIALAKMYVSEHPAAKRFKDYHVINEKTEIEFNSASIQFFKTTHSIPDSLGVVIKTEDGSIVYTGDFKFDQSAKSVYRTDFNRLAQIGSDKVLMLLSDAYGADMVEPVVSERQIQDKMEETFRYWEGRIIAGCIAANIQRIQQILNAAARTNRKVVVSDSHLDRIVKIAIKHNKLRLAKKDLMISIKDANKYHDDELVVLVAGKMGEPIQAIQRMAKGQHRRFNIQEGDLVYLATTPSLEMEIFVSNTENMIYRAGGTVKTVSDHFNASSHADADQLSLLINLLHPKYIMPVQGEFRQFKALADLAVDLGIPRRNIFLTKAGDIVESDGKRCRLAGSISMNEILIDGLGVGDVGNIVLRDRKVLSEDGIFVAVVSIDRKRKRIINRPLISSRGFVYVKASRDLLKDASDMVQEIVNEHLAKDDFEWNDLKQEIRDRLSRYLFEQTRRRPVVLPVIMEATDMNRRPSKRKAAKKETVKKKNKKSTKSYKKAE